MTPFLTGFQDYLKNQKCVSSNTMQSYIRDIEHFSMYLESIALNEPTAVSAEGLQRYMESLEQLGRSASTITRNIASIRCFYQYLILIGAASENPAKEIKREKAEKKPPSILTGEEIRLLLNQPNVMDPKGCRDKAMIELLYATGIRVSELIDLNLQDVNLKTGMLHCRRPKSDRVIPIYAEAVSSLSDYISRIRKIIIDPAGKDGQALFVNLNGHRLTRQGFWKIIKGYAAQARITKDITPHTLRHSFALHLLQNGADLKDIQEMLGHADIASTQVYANLLNNRFQNVYNHCHPMAKKA